MENQHNEQSPVRALQKAYLRVIQERHANASMLRWSLDFARSEKARQSGNGVTLYLL